MSVIETSYYLVQIALSIVIIWYAYETRKLRVTSEMQLKELKDANNMAVRPNLSFGINILQKSEDNVAINFLKNDLYLPLSYRNEYIKLIEKGVKIFQISIKNAIDNVAIDLQAVIYDGFARNYIFGETGVVICGKDDNQFIYTARDTYLNYEDICNELNDKYGNSKPLHKYLEVPKDRQNANFVFVFCQTVKGEIILFKREIEFIDGGVTLKKIERHVSSC